MRLWGGLNDLATRFGFGLVGSAGSGYRELSRAAHTLLEAELGTY